MPTSSSEPRTPETPSAEDETAWLKLAQGGNRAAFARIVELYWDRLYRWLFQLSRDQHRAEDLTQETFLKALNSLHSFRLGSNFRAWLFRIGHNNFADLKRADKRQTQALPEDSPEKENPGPEGKVEQRELLNLVAKAIAELPADFRAALLLRAEEDLSFREIAGVLGISEETARWRVFKARQKLVRSIPAELLPGLAPAE